jgi:hypothetical protein
MGIDEELLDLCLREYVRRSMRSAKRRADWRESFREVVRRNAYGQWFIEVDGKAVLTSRGRQAQKLHGMAPKAGSAAANEAKRWATEQDQRLAEVEAARAARGGQGVPAAVAEALERMGVRRKRKGGEG